MSRKPTTKHFSISKVLKKENRSSDLFEMMLSTLTLEEVISLKLELSARAASHRLYGLPIWHSMNHIIKESVLKYAISATKTKGEAMRFLGLKPADFNRLMKKYDVDSFFIKNSLDKKAQNS